MRQEVDTDAPIIGYEPGKAVFVSDMGGFSRLTRQHGILHVASLIIQMQHLFRLACDDYQAEIFWTCADNCFALFPSSAHALEAAMACADLTHKFNSLVSDAAFQIELSGVSIVCEGAVYQEPDTGQPFGETVDLAFHLAEDIANDGAMLLAEQAYAQVASDPRFQDVTFTRQFDGQSAYYAVTGALHRDRVPLHSLADLIPLTTEPPPAMSEQFIRDVLRRPGMAPTERQHLDRLLIERFMQEGVAVVLGLDVAAIRQAYGPSGAVAWARQLAATTAPIIERHGGFAVEVALYVFPNGVQSFAAILELQELMGEFITGIAAHAGQLLIVPDTVVHWGDPVNTASKLAEDVASQGEVYITESIYHQIQSHPSANTMTFRQQSFAISRIELPCFQILKNRG